MCVYYFIFNLNLSNSTWKLKKKESKTWKTEIAAIRKVPLNQCWKQRKTQIFQKKDCVLVNNEVNFEKYQIKIRLQLSGFERKSWLRMHVKRV